jgi:transcriptional regulator with XRE-family HTH domain
MDMRRLLGRNVLRIRKSKNLTQEELAEMSGFSQQYISGLEKGQCNPTVVTVYELSLSLGVNYIELLKPDTLARACPQLCELFRGTDQNQTRNVVL